MLLIFIYIVLFIISIRVLLKASRAKCKSPKCLIGKTAIVTGGNSGIGYGVALNLATRGCKVIIADVANSIESTENIINSTNNKNISWKYLDLSSFESVRKFAKEINENENRLDLLYNNAAIGASDQSLTVDGFNILIQVNYLGPFLLTHLLLDLLKKNDDSRIIFTSSLLAYIHNLNMNIFTHTFKDSPVLTQYRLYGSTKVLLVIIAKMFAEKLKTTGVTVYSVNPGLTITPMHLKTYNHFKILNLVFPYNLFAKLTSIVAKNVDEAIQTLLYVGLSQKVKRNTGKYFSNCTVWPIPRIANNKEFCNSIWKFSEQCVKLKKVH